jgi:hypothetical protein
MFVIAIVAVAFSDELSDKKVHEFAAIRPLRRQMRDCMGNLSDVSIVSIAFFFCVGKGAKSAGASGNQAAPEGTSRNTSEVHTQAPYVVAEWVLATQLCLCWSALAMHGASNVHHLETGAFTTG